MSERFPIIATTGSSGSGTTSVKNTFERIFRREGIKAAFIEGDAFHRYDRVAMKKKVAEEVAKGNPHFSHFGPEANQLDKLEGIFAEFGKQGTGRTRQYVHNLQEEQMFGAPQGTFTPWLEFKDDCDLLFYEGLHGAYRSPELDIASHADLKIGVVPVINLEWIQKIHRDKEMRGYSTEAVTDVILRRMHDYVHYICPQFTETDINFQRVPTVDTSNPFVARWIPTADESMVVIRFRSPRGIDFAYLLSMIHDSFMSRANSIVVPGGKMELAMQLILTPKILRLIDRKSRAV
ncbi:Phosphoribulokinase 1 [Hartmannibacter diazotrophicus]|uniref:Phosphoribulokinase n=1 Tax=Hartmannibacter diazotrophicus TaxID=1482074 RepID=A0A2C9D6D3_9HYPH|nr:phosphoribulokinase [Hartmannibacter diazotrophicus]SON55750.1 Phosphoribulokinase 1 [Hartmannibacter diazotrophicus]